ncbi:hypothetical protein AB4144_50855, partial [Rhizobiaceae sp. 2RAB30]
MAMGLKVGDKITLHWTVRKVLDDGEIALSHPLYSTPITINANEVDEAAVERGKGPPPAPAKKVRYAIGVTVKDLSGRRFQRTLATADTDEEAEALKDLH